VTQRTRRRNASWSSLAILFSSLLAAPQIRAQQKIDWPEATAQLNNLRPKAITCVGLIKRYGTHSKVTRAAMNYADGKSEVDSVISGLTVALTPRRRSPPVLLLPPRGC
jgi:hypothetical protein